MPDTERAEGHYMEIPSSGKRALCAVGGMKSFLCLDFESHRTKYWVMRLKGKAGPVFKRLATLLKSLALNNRRVL